MDSVGDSRSALVVIDVQNEFFDLKGNFPIHNDCRERVIANLKALIPRFRKEVGHVIWVKAMYLDRSEEPPAMKAQEKGDRFVGRNEWLSAATHVCPISCCKEGTFGAEMYSEVYTLWDPKDDIVIKGGYSSFNTGDGPTTFEKTLQKRNIDNIFLCGTASGTCVLATAVDAVKIEGLQVNAVVDCCGGRRENTHVEAIERYKALGVKLVNSNNISVRVALSWSLVLSFCVEWCRKIFLTEQTLGKQ
jgi:nicotinamidase-related amidase